MNCIYSISTRAPVDPSIQVVPSISALVKRSKNWLSYLYLARCTTCLIFHLDYCFLLHCETWSYVFTNICCKITPIFYLKQSLPTETASFEFVILKTKLEFVTINMFLEVNQNIEKRNYNWCWLKYQILPCPPHPRR